MSELELRYVHILVSRSLPFFDPHEGVDHHVKQHLMGTLDNSIRASGNIKINITQFAAGVVRLQTRECDDFAVHFSGGCDRPEHVFGIS